MGRTSTIVFVALIATMTACSGGGSGRTADPKPTRAHPTTTTSTTAPARSQYQDCLDFIRLHDEAQNASASGGQITPLLPAIDTALTACTSTSVTAACNQYFALSRQALGDLAQIPTLTAASQQGTAGAIETLTSVSQRYSATAAQLPPLYTACIASGVVTN